MASANSDSERGSPRPAALVKIERSAIRHSPQAGRGVAQIAVTLRCGQGIEFQGGRDQRGSARNGFSRSEQLQSLDRSLQVIHVPMLPRSPDRRNIRLPWPQYPGKRPCRPAGVASETGH